MHSELGDYTVVAVKNVGTRTSEAGSEAPPEILERFEGRMFTMRELEERGVRIAGGHAYYTANGTDWQLELFPKVD